VPSRDENLSKFTNGVYLVSEACRILQPKMTPRKVHYWLDTGLLSPAVVPGGRGSPTLLSFRQLLELRTVQYLRDELVFSLPRVRQAFEFILNNLFAESFSDLRFLRGVDGALLVQVGRDAMVVPGGQGVLPETLPELNLHVQDTRESWDRKTLDIPHHRQLVSNARVQAGSPTVRGTRIETAFIASFAEKGVFSEETVVTLKTQLGLTRDSIVESMAFEGIQIAA